MYLAIKKNIRKIVERTKAYTTACSPDKKRREPSPDSLIGVRMKSGKASCFCGSSGRVNVFQIKLLAVLFFIFFAGLSFAGDISLKAYVSKNTVGLQEQFSYSVEVSGQSASLPSPDFPEFRDFYVLSGPNSSTNIQWINGRMSSSKTFTFYLQAQKEGQLTIGAVTLNYEGKRYSSGPVTINVVKNKSVAPSPAQRKPAPSREDSEISGQSIYLKTTVSKRNVYLGEQIILTYKLYFRTNLRGYDFKKLPTNPGFWKEEFKLPAQPVIENEVVNGMRYNVVTLRKQALFPTQTGELRIDPMEIVVEALVRKRRSSRSLFDSFFDDPFGRTIQKTVIGKALTIKVKPLPEQGKPANFSGAVGNYNFKVLADKKRVKANEPITVKLIVSGSGNIKMIELPKLKLPSDIEQYEPALNTNIKHKSNTVSGSKTAEYTLIPRIEGQYEIKALSFSWFDPHRGKYRSVSSAPIRLTIEKGKQSFLSSGRGVGNLGGKEVALLGRDIRYIKEYSQFEAVGYKAYLNPFYLLSIFTGLFLFLAFIIYNNRQAALLGNEKLARSRKAGKIASRQLSRARSMLNNPQETAFYKAISQALQGFVRDRLNIELTEFSKAAVRKKLSERNIGQEEIDEYIAVLEESDFRQYAGTFAGQEDRNEFYEKAKTILTKLEKWI